MFTLVLVLQRSLVQVRGMRSLVLTMLLMRYGHFGGSSSRPFGEGGSRPPSVTRSDDEDDGGDDDGDDVE
jgi:hypothetical protein